MLDCSRLSVTSTRPPLGVNLTAFETRFHTTCWMRTASHEVPLADGSSCTFNVMPRASAAGRTASTPALITSVNSQGRMSTRSLPETMRDTSRTSSMSCTCALVLRSMTSSPSCKVSRLGVLVRAGC